MVLLERGFVLGDEQLGVGDLFLGVKPVDVQSLNGLASSKRSRIGPPRFLQACRWV